MGKDHQEICVNMVVFNQCREMAMEKDGQEKGLSKQNHTVTNKETSGSRDFES